MSRKHAWTKSVLVLAVAAVLGASLIHQGRARAATDGSNDFIVRCFFNGNVAAQDPILKPGTANTDHLHAFFGNLAAGSAAADGTPFPAMQSGDYNVSADTMEQNGLSPATTNCQDPKDTAGYWTPEPYTVNPLGVTAPQLPGGAGGCHTNVNSCSPGVYLHQRVYYIPHGSQPNAEIPDGTIMVAGYPNGCQTVPPLPTPDGCTGNPPTTRYPQDMQIIQYACGADQKNHNATPLSEWPYDCTPYLDGDDNFSDGAVAEVRFPYCWDGSLTGNFPAPNSPKDPNTGLPTHKVPGYVAPWIPYDVWHTKYNMPARPQNDFGYPNSNGVCNDPNYPDYVVQLQERNHLLTNGAGWGPPSSCTGDGGIGWNTLGNAEMSNNTSDTSNSSTGQIGDGDGDARVPVASGIWGPTQCAPSSGPMAQANTYTLSFACSQGTDPACTVPLSSPTGCVTATGTCYVGSYPYGWETLHADYWQTWEEATSKLDNPGDTNADLGTFGDLVDDCTSGTGTKGCEFIVTKNNTPALVYGAGNP